MAKATTFTMLYAIKSTYRVFDGVGTVAITVSENPNSKTGVRVYRQPDSEWVATILDACGISVSDLAEMQDGDTLPTDEPIELEEGRTFTQKVPPLVQYFTANGQEVSRVVDTVSGVITQGSALRVDDLVRQTMRRRLTARDSATGNYQYGVPNRKSILAALAEYWIGTDDRTSRQDLDDYVAKLDGDDDEQGFALPSLFFCFFDKKLYHCYFNIQPYWTALKKPLSTIFKRNTIIVYSN